MASSITVNGRRTVTPGAYSETDAEGLNVASLSAVGIVAVLGTAEGGLPVASITDKSQITRFRSAQRAREAFRSGQLAEVSNMLFRPSFDSAIPGGVVEYVAMKTNPATKSSAVLTNGAGDAMAVTSRDYGAFTEQISFDLQTGTNKGKLYTVQFEDVIEVHDDVGGDALATLAYVPGAEGYTTMAASVNAAGDIAAAGTKSTLGKDVDLDNPITNVAAEIISTLPDTATVELFGLVAGVPTIEEFTLNGAAAVVGSVVWDAGKLLGVRATGTVAGVVTVREIGGAGVDVFTGLTGTDQELGLLTCTNVYVADGALAFISDGASTQDVIVYGVDKVGSVRSEAIALTGVVSVPSVLLDYARIDLLIYGDVEVAQTVTMSAPAVATTAASQNTLQKVQNVYNARQTVVSPSVTEGFDFVMTSGDLQRDPADLDSIVSTSILTALSLTGDFAALIAHINTHSALVSAAASTGATALPDNTPSPVFLAGGIEGIVTFDGVQAAIDMLKQIRVNTVVDLSGDPAVAAALNAHCAYMGGVGRSERDAVVGVYNTGLTDVPTKTELKAAAVNLNSRHMRVVGQAVTHPNIAGVTTEFDPPFLAAMIAAMQAGSEVGEPLTRKTMDALSVRSDPSWNSAEDSDELIDAGVLIVEDVDGIGRRVVRNVTTYLQSDNIAYVEASTNEAANVSVFNLREAVDFAAGQKSFSGTKSAIRTEAKANLALQIKEEYIVAYQNLEIVFNGSGWDISVEIAAVTPTNFILIKAHLISSAQFLN